jgi:hypothetical protein
LHLLWWLLRGEAADEERDEDGAGEQRGRGGLGEPGGGDGSWRGLSRGRENEREDVGIEREAVGIFSPTEI